MSTEFRFRNPFDATKSSDYDALPECLKKNGFVLVHLGRGNYAFVRGNGYHYFEPVQEVKSWNPPESVVSSLGTSEANVVSTIYEYKNDS